MTTDPLAESVKLIREQILVESSTPDSVFSLVVPNQINAMALDIARDHPKGTTRAQLAVAIVRNAEVNPGRLTKAVPSLKTLTPSQRLDLVHAGIMPVLPRRRG